MPGLVGTGDGRTMGEEMRIESQEEYDIEDETKNIDGYALNDIGIVLNGNQMSLVDLKKNMAYVHTACRDKKWYVSTGLSIQHGTCFGFGGPLTFGGLSFATKKISEVHGFREIKKTLESNMGNDQDVEACRSLIKMIDEYCNEEQPELF